MRPFRPADLVVKFPRFLCRANPLENGSNFHSCEVFVFVFLCYAIALESFTLSPSGFLRTGLSVLFSEKWALGTFHACTALTSVVTYTEWRVLVFAIVVYQATHFLVTGTRRSIVSSGRAYSCLVADFWCWRRLFGFLFELLGDGGGVVAV